MIALLVFTAFMDALLAWLYFRLQRRFPAYTFLLLSAIKFGFVLGIDV